LKAINTTDYETGYITLLIIVMKRQKLIFKRAANFPIRGIFQQILQMPN